MSESPREDGSSKTLRERFESVSWMPGRNTVLLAAVVLLVAIALGALILVLFPESRAAAVLSVLIQIIVGTPDTLGKIYGPGFVKGTLRTAVPIVFAGLGGIFAEKSGVINIGLEGLLIISAFTAVAVTHIVSGGATAAQSTVWLGFLVGTLASTLLAVIFAAIVIEFKADQIIAGLAVWLVGLGLGPFLSIVLWGSVNSDSVATIDRVTLPVLWIVENPVADAVVAVALTLDAVLSAIPVVGSVLSSIVGLFPAVVGPILEAIFIDTSPIVLVMLVTIGLVWYVFRYSTFGRWIEASGENPSSLDTAGVDVHRVRYIGVTLSGVLAGMGGAGLAVGRVGRFIGSGQTMINGDGWIAITTYLFGNYNPLGTAGAGFLFASLDALQIRLQQIPFIPAPTELIRLVPYVAVIIVLAFVGYTRIPSEAGEHYESGEE